MPCHSSWCIIAKVAFLGQKLLYLIYIKCSPARVTLTSCIIHLLCKTLCSLPCILFGTLKHSFNGMACAIIIVFFVWPTNSMVPSDGMPNIVYKHRKCRMSNNGFQYGFCLMSCYYNGMLVGTS